MEGKDCVEDGRTSQRGYSAVEEKGLALHSLFELAR